MTPELIEQKNNLVSSMLNYMKFGAADDENDPEYDPDFDAGYSEQHVEQCAKTLDGLFAALSKVSDADKNESILGAVKTAVVKLNQLNEVCGCGLIETDQREDLCEIIISAAKHAGLESSTYDITEEWREW